MSKKRKIVIGFGIFIALIVIWRGYAMWNMQPAPYQGVDSENTSLTLLEKTCAEKTKNNPDGHVYDAIIGRYLASKSETHVPPSNTNYKNFTHKMVFQIPEDEVQIFINFPQNWYKEFGIIMVEVVGRETLDNKEDTDHQYGICAYRNKYDKYVGLIETFKRIDNND